MIEPKKMVPAAQSWRPTMNNTETNAMLAEWMGWKVLSLDTGRYWCDAGGYPQCHENGFRPDVLVDHFALVEAEAIKRFGERYAHALWDLVDELRELYPEELILAILTLSLAAKCAVIVGLIEADKEAGP